MGKGSASSSDQLISVTRKRLSARVEKQRIFQGLSASIVSGRAGQADRVTMPYVGVGGISGLRPEHFLEDQDVAGMEIWKRAGECGFGRALGQAARRIAPGVEAHLIVFRVEGRVPHRLKDLDAGPQCRLLIAGIEREVCRHAGSEGVEARARTVQKNLVSRISGGL